MIVNTKDFKITFDDEVVKKILGERELTIIFLTDAVANLQARIAELESQLRKRNNFEDTIEEFGHLNG